MTMNQELIWAPETYAQRRLDPLVKKLAEGKPLQDICRDSYSIDIELAQVDGGATFTEWLEAHERFLEDFPASRSFANTIQKKYIGGLHAVTTSSGHFRHFMSMKMQPYLDCGGTEITLDTVEAMNERTYGLCEEFLRKYCGFDITTFNRYLQLTQEGTFPNGQVFCTIVHGCILPYDADRLHKALS